jgi:hypothetical protein
VIKRFKDWFQIQNVGHGLKPLENTEEGGFFSWDRYICLPCVEFYVDAVCLFLGKFARFCFWFFFFYVFVVCIHLQRARQGFCNGKLCALC